MATCLKYSIISAAFLAFTGTAASAGPGGGPGAVGPTTSSATAGTGRAGAQSSNGDKADQSGRGVKSGRGVAGASGFSLNGRLGIADEESLIRIGGYIQPTMGLRYRPLGLPRDQFDYSAAGTRVGFIVSGEPIERFSYTLHVVATGQMLTESGNPTSDKTGGLADGRTPLFGAIRPFTAVGGTSRLASGMRVEQVSIAYQPIDGLHFKAGQMRVPFTVDQFSGNTQLMFPTRSAPTQVFLRGTDLGATAEYDWKSIARISAGVFNGARISGNGDSRGLLYSVRADVNPLGPMPGQQADFDRGGLRLGLGAGMVYLPTTSFDSSGFASVSSRDLRGSASVRLAYRGFYFQAEALRRQRTDNLTARPLIATGGYGQASFYLPIKGRFSLAPIARVGFTREDQSFSPRDSLWTEAGTTLYFGRNRSQPDDLSITLQYLGEQRITDRENAHGAVLRAQLRW